MATHTYAVFIDEEARLLADLIGIEYDLKTTAIWCDLLSNAMSNHDELDLLEPLNTSVLTRFQRAFGSGVRVKVVKELLNVLSEEEMRSYSYFRDLRDKYIAHSVNEFEENYVKLYYILESPEKGVQSIGTGSSRLISLSLDDIETIKKLCEKLLSAVTEKMAAEKKRILSIAQNIPKDELLEMGMESPKHPKDVDVRRGRR